MIENNLFKKTETNLQISIPIHGNHRGNHCGRWGGEGRIGRVGITNAHYCIKYIINKDLLYSIGKSTQKFVTTYMGEKEWIVIYMTDSLCVHLKVIQHCKFNYTPIAVN